MTTLHRAPQQLPLGKQRPSEKRKVNKVFASSSPHLKNLQVSIAEDQHSLFPYNYLRTFTATTSGFTWGEYEGCSHCWLKEGLGWWGGSYLWRFRSSQKNIFFLMLAFSQGGKGVVPGFKPCFSLYIFLGSTYRVRSVHRGSTQLLTRRNQREKMRTVSSCPPSTLEGLIWP